MKLQLKMVCLGPPSRVTIYLLIGRNRCVACLAQWIERSLPIFAVYRRGETWTRDRSRVRPPQWVWITFNTPLIHPSFCPSPSNWIENPSYERAMDGTLPYSRPHSLTWLPLQPQSLDSPRHKGLLVQDGKTSLTNASNMLISPSKSCYEASCHPRVFHRPNGPPIPPTPHPQPLIDPRDFLWGCGELGGATSN